MARRRKSHEGLLDELARSTQEEFHGIRSFQEQTTKTLVTVVDTLDLIRADIHDIKLTLGPLVHHVAAMERDMADLKKRVGRVERKVGLAK